MAKRPRRTDSGPTLVIPDDGYSRLSESDRLREQARLMREWPAFLTAIGATPAARMRDLLALVYLPVPLTRLPPWKRRRVAKLWLVMALAHGAAFIEEDLPADTYWAAGIGPGGMRSQLSPAVPSGATLEAIRRDLHRGVEALLAGRPWRLSGHLSAVALPDHGVRLDGDFRARVTYVIASQLIAERAHIRRCKRCGQPFYGIKRAEYCSTACGQRFRDAKKKKAAPRRGGGRKR